MRAALSILCAAMLVAVAIVAVVVALAAQRHADVARGRANCAAIAGVSPRLADCRR